MADDTWTGGCQCGAVRYAIASRPRQPLICHCRMCQKQVGGPFGAYAETDAAEFTVTRGALSYFRSSDTGERSFCRDCGTPLGFRYQGGAVFAITIGSLDRHAELSPEMQAGIESRVPWFAGLALLPERPTAEIAAHNRQHPDHETERWPPGRR